MSADATMTMKCALYRSLSAHPWTTVFSIQGGGVGVFPGYVQVSDAVTVEFPQLSNNDVIAGAVRSLDETRRKTVEEFTEKLANIDQQRKELLALTHQAQS